MVDEVEEIMNERTDNNDAVQKMVQICTEYLQKIEIQAATTQPDINADDIVLQYIQNELGINNEEEIHNLTIMINDNLTQIDKNLLLSFTDGLNITFNKTFGVNLTDNDIRLSYYLYIVLVTQFINYFVNYVDGLQKININYKEDIPNFQEVSFKYFKDKYKKDSESIQSDITDYLDYIIEYCIFPEMYFELALLGSPGNQVLSCLYLESANGRVTYDSDFFKLKISKILSSNIKEVLIERLINILGE